MKFQLSKILLAFSVSALCACSTVSVNKSSAELMPKEVAIQIFVKQFGRNWVDSPKLKQPPLCGGEYISIEFSDIDSAEYLLPSKSFQFKSSKFRKLVCASPRVVLARMPKETAVELVKAAIALGANVEMLEVGPD
jgi:hypothetical protein